MSRPPFPQTALHTVLAYSLAFSVAGLCLWHEESPLNFLDTCPMEEQRGELKRYLEESRGPKVCSSSTGLPWLPSHPASHPLGWKLLILQAFHAAHWPELFMLPGPWGGNLSRVKDKPVAEPKVGSELGTDCAFTMSQSQKSVFLCMEDFGPTLLGPLLAGSVGHPIPSHLSSITNSGSKRPLDSRARVHIPVWAFHPCIGGAASLFCAFISSGNKNSGARFLGFMRILSTKTVGTLGAGAQGDFLPSAELVILSLDRALVQRGWLCTVKWWG